MLLWMLRLPTLAAVLLAALVSRRDRAHRPIAVALAVALTCDLTRALAPLPDRVALALYLVPALLGAWCGARAFLPPERRILPAALLACGLLALTGWVLLAPHPRAWWTVLPALTYGCALLVQAPLAARWVRRILASATASATTAGASLRAAGLPLPAPRTVYRSPPAEQQTTPAEGSSIAPRVALVLIAGDLALLLGPLAWGGRWTVAGVQTAIVAAVIAWMQARSLRRRDEPGRLALPG